VSLTSVLFAAAIGILGGLRHAFEPDHLAAVSTMVVRERTSFRRITFAATWGFGHALMLLCVGGLLASVRMELPERVTDMFEGIVGVVLVVLGVRSIALARRLPDVRASVVHHSHGKQTHAHPSHGHHVHLFRRTFSAGPLLVGLTHGLAGSGALATLVIAKTDSTAWALSFIALYGAGATLGMALMAALISVPLTHVARRPFALRATVAASGLVSAAMGVVWLAPLVSRNLL